MSKQPNGPPPAFIRAYDHEKDFKFLRYLIGASILSRTGPANVNLFWSNPLVYLWAIAFSLYVPITHMVFADKEIDTVDFKSAAIMVIKHMPVFVGPPLILLALLNWCHRIHFNSIMSKALHADDLRDPKSYYGTPTKLGRIWLLEYDGRPLGVVSVEVDSEKSHDARPPDLQKTRISSTTSDNQVMRIRHLATSIQFRPAGIDLDLATHAVSSCFADHDTVQRVMISLIPVLDDVQISAVETIGFRRAISAQTAPSSLWTRFMSIIRTVTGWPDCQKRWKEEIWVLERSQFNPKLD